MVRKINLRVRIEGDEYNTILLDIDKWKEIYAEPRIREYVREEVDNLIKKEINEYAQTPEAEKFLYGEWEKAKMIGERKRIRIVEKNIEKYVHFLSQDPSINKKNKKNLEESLEKDIKTQIPGNLQQTYLKLLKIELDNETK